MRFVRWIKAIWFDVWNIAPPNGAIQVTITADTARLEDALKRFEKKVGKSVLKAVNDSLERGGKEAVRFRRLVKK